jgi:uncharacterized protein YcnI
MNRTATLAAAAGALAFPAGAQAHVSIHPNVIPTGASATLSLRVPNEMDNADTTGIRVQVPPGFTDISAEPPAGWRFSTKTRKLAKPVQTDDGPVTEEVSELDFTGGHLPPGQFALFPLSVTMPGHAGQVLTFKTLQTYSNGKVVRWIGSQSSDSPAPWIDVSAKNGDLRDVAGAEAGPPPGAGKTAAAGSASTPASRTSAVVVKKSSGASKGLAIAALILGALGLIAGSIALAGRRRTGVA